MAITDRPAWAADVPVSMPVPADEAQLVQMFGFAMTQYRLVPALSAAEYETLSILVYAPEQPVQDVSADDADLDAGRVGDDAT